MTVVVHWREASPYGPSLEFVCQVGDMGDARALARRASAMAEPDKAGRLPASAPLAGVAARFPGELLWRPVAAGGGEEEWRVGADAARRFREADVERFNATQDAARERRHDRRHHHHHR